MKIESPCVNICQLDDRDICLGCLRTRDEIARWLRMTDSERSAIIAALGGRRARPGGICEVKSNEVHLDTVLEIAGTTPSPPWNGGGAG